MRLKSNQLGLAFLLLFVLITENVLASYGGGRPQTISGKILLFMSQKYFYTTLFLYFIPMSVSVTILLMYKSINRVSLLTVTLLSTCALILLIPQLKAFPWDSSSINERIVKTLIYYLIYTYITAMQLYAFYLTTNIRLILILAKGFAYSGVIIITSIIVLFWQFTGRTTGYSEYESILVYSLAIITIMIGLDYKYKCEIIGAYVLPCIILGLVRETTHIFSIDTIRFLWTNGWLLPYTFSHSVAHAVFAISFGISTMYLLASAKKNQSAEKLIISYPFPSAELLGNLLIKTIEIGFLLLTLSIIAHTAFLTSMWGFQFGDIWPYATWLMYAILMMYRAFNEQKVNIFAWGSIASFFVSMHSYVGCKDFFRGL